MNRRESGFSILELMVAITVTLIISSAIFGLMGAGQSRFKTEPMLSERQQNIRMALDMIERDIANAGNKMAPLHQVFITTGNAVGPLGPGRGNGDIAGADNSDFLEIWGNDGECPDIPGAPIGGTTTFAVGAGFQVPDCYPASGAGPVLVRFNSATAPRWTWATGIPVRPSGPGGIISFGPFPASYAPKASEINAAGDLNEAMTVAALSVTRYEIFYTPGGPGGSPFPSLYRSITGGRDAGGNYQAAPEPTGNWQLVAAGIEDLQVIYEMADGTLADVPAVISTTPAGPPNPAYSNVVRTVRVTLSARVIAANPRDMEGGYASEANMDGLSPGATRARRGSLSCSFTPRAVLTALSDTNLVPPAIRWN
jgi:type II secretory pathway pseudopilin PulG